MLQTISGIYRDGKVELAEKPNVEENTQVIVTFLEQHDGIDLKTVGIGPAEAAKLRESLASFSDWDSPEMSKYDDYDAAKSSL